jgi:Viral BACON domain
MISFFKIRVRQLLRMVPLGALAFAVASVLSVDASCQTYDLTMDVLVNSGNTTGYNTSTSSPGEYQRYLERYLEHLQIPYRVVDTATQAPPSDLGMVQLIVAGHTGLSLSSAWQQAILTAVQGGSGFVNFDADPTIGAYDHMKGIFGSTGSQIGAGGTVIAIPSAVMPDGATPHYIAGMQIRLQNTPPGDIIYSFHKDPNGIQQVATPTVLQGAQGTVIALVGNSPLILATQTGGGRAVDFTTYDFMHPDRFGFMMGIDDLIWRSMVWAARKPFILRGYPRFYASQMDDEVVGWGARLRDLWNPAYTGNVASDGTGGPWKITAMAQMVNLQPGGQDRTDAIADVNAGFLKIAFHTNTGISEGDFYWNPQSPDQLTDAQWQTNLASAMQIIQGQGGADTLPPLSKSMVPHFWNLSNNTGYDLWHSLNVRYITEIQQPGAYYSFGPPKPSSMRLHTHPFRVYELPPTGVNPNELYTLYSADFMTVGSTAGLPPQKFFTFTTQLLGSTYPSFDARWPNDNQAIGVQESVNNFTEYTWRFWSSMAPVQMYNHDGGSFENGTETERQQAITQISSFLNARGVRHVFMEDMGAYMCARTTSVLSTAQASSSSLTLNFTGNATDMDGNLVPTNFYIFYGDNEGIQQTTPGFNGGYTFTTPNAAPPSIGLGTTSLVLSALPGASPVTQTVAVNNTGSGTLTYSTHSSASWLSATAGTGTAPDTLTIKADPGQLAPGVYNGTVQITAPGALNSPQTINVTFAVQGPTLLLSATSLGFSGFAGGSNPAAQNVLISNMGAGAMNWTASSSAPWLQLNANSGTTMSGSPFTLAVTPNITGLSPGTYNATVTVSSSNAVSGSPQTLSVTLTLTGILMQTNFSAATLDGFAYSPQGTPAGWSLGNGVLRYSGAGATQLYAGSAGWSNYTVQDTFQLSTLADYPGGVRGYINPSTGASYAAWLYPNEGFIKIWRTTAWNINTSPVLLGTSGHLVTDNVNPHTLALSINAGKLIASYDGVAVLTVNDATLTSGMAGIDVSTQPIQFQKFIVTGNQSIQAQLTSPVSSLVFTVPAGTTSTSQSVQVGTSDSSVVAWSAFPPASWLSIAPTTGQTPGTASVQANASSLTPGVYNTSLNLASFGVANNPLSVPVTVNVTQPSTNQLTASPTSLAFNAAVTGPAPAPQSVNLTSTTPGVSFSSSSDAAWLTTSGTGTTPGTLSVFVNQAGLAPGTYTGHITITAPAAMNPTTVMAVTLTLSQNPPVTLMQASFPGSTLDGWTYSPQGLASNWSVSNGVVSYNGGGATQIYAGNSAWANYAVQSSFRLSSLTDYPGGIRGYVNPSTGASYAAWLYPAEGVIKVWRTTTWNINTSPALLGTSAHLSMDTTNWHVLALSINGGRLVASYDGTAVVTVSDSTLSGGMIALDVSSKPIQFSNVLVTGTQAITTQVNSAQTSFTFAVPSGSSSTTQPLQVSTTDGSIAVWSAYAPVPWLTAAAPSGQTPGSANVQVNAASLAPGTYTSQLNLASYGGTNTPVAIPVSVTVTAPSTNQVTVAPTSLTFAAVAGSVAPSAQSLTISSSTAGLSATIASDAGWLTSTTSGVTPFAAQVSVNQSGLTAGSYTGHLTISAPGAVNPTTTVTVTLTVTNPSLAASPASLSFVGSTTTNAPTQPLQITNVGGGAVGWSGTYGSTWFSPSTSNATTPSTIQTGALSSGLAAGSYSDVFTLTPSVGTGTPTQVPVSLRVGPLLFQDTFTSSAQWKASPMGLAGNWTILNNTFSYNGGGATQQYAGSAAWTDYTLQADVTLNTTSNFPGGIRFRLNPSTGAAYVVWLYPGTSQVKLLKATVWNINTNATTLSTVSKSLTTGTHHLRIDVRGSSITVFIDYSQVISFTDTSYSAGAIALDVSNQPVAFSNVSVVSF